MGYRLPNYGAYHLGRSQRVHRDRVDGRADGDEVERQKVAWSDSLRSEDTQIERRAGCAGCSALCGSGLRCSRIGRQGIAFGRNDLVDHTAGGGSCSRGITMNTLSVALNRIACPQSIRCQDVALLLRLPVLHQRNVRTSSRIILDPQHLLLARFPTVEVHQPDPPSVSTTPTAHRDVSMVIPSRRTTLGNRKRSHGSALVKMLVERLPQPPDGTGDGLVRLELSILAHKRRCVGGRYTQSHRYGRFGHSTLGFFALFLDGCSTFLARDLGGR